MPRISAWFFKAAVIFLVIGVAIGIHMAISQNHGVIGAHAHINLLGWVTSAIFGVYYALNPAKAEGRLPMVHFAVYTAGVTVMVAALYFLLQGNASLEPVVAVGSLVTFAGVLLFGYVVFAPAKHTARARAVPAE